MWLNSALRQNLRSFIGLKFHCHTISFILKPHFSVNTLNLMFAQIHLSLSSFAVWRGYESLNPLNSCCCLPKKVLVIFLILHFNYKQQKKPSGIFNTLFWNPLAILPSSLGTFLFFTFYITSHNNVAKYFAGISWVFIKITFV